MAKLFSPLSGDTISPLNAPPVRVGLFTKLNLLAIGLIIATALGVAAFLIGQQIRDETSRLKTQGLTVAAMVAEVADEAIGSADMANIASVLDGLGSDRDVAYVAVLDADQRLLITRAYSDTAVPTTPIVLPTAGNATVIERGLADRRPLELVVPVHTAPRLGNQAGAAGRPVIGYVRLGMSFDRGWARMRANLIGALSVVATLVVVSIVLTLVLTRRIVAPMRQLMRAARAVGAGKLDVYVPAKSSDELGLLTHTFNHMTQRLAESQAEVATYQRTLEDAGIQAGAARHLDRAAQPRAPEPALAADRRPGGARGSSGRVPVSRLRSLQAHQRYTGSRRRRSVAASSRAAPDERRARIGHRCPPGW
jgi:HAMP domain-containing protein